MRKLQLMAGGMVRQPTGLKAVGIDYKEEVRRMMEEQTFAAEASGGCGPIGPRGPTGPAGSAGPARLFNRNTATYTNAANIRR
jgi:hypothetical protein